MTRTERIEAALATKCGAMEYYLEEQKGGNLTLFFETVRDKESGRNIARLHDKDAAILFAAAADLRDEVLALRGQVERQRQILCKVAMLRRKILSIEQCESYEGGSPDLGTARTLGEIKAISAEADALDWIIKALPYLRGIKEGMEAPLMVEPTKYDAVCALIAQAEGKEVGAGVYLSSHPLTDDLKASTLSDKEG